MAGKNVNLQSQSFTMASHNELGKWGEHQAQRYLLLHGYHILDVDWHLGHRDLDIVAEKLGFIIFVEVKTRSTDQFMAPEEAVNKEKIRNLLTSANAYLNKYKIDKPCQFDIIAIVGNPENFHIEHHKDAFDAYNWNDDFEYKGIYGGTSQIKK
jgi:putative endonuclease